MSVYDDSDQRVAHPAGRPHHEQRDVDGDDGDGECEFHHRAEHHRHQRGDCGDCGGGGRGERGADETGLMTREELFAAIQKQMRDATDKMLREYERHALACEDPVGCEVRAWQALFRDERMK